MTEKKERKKRHLGDPCDKYGKLWTDASAPSTHVKCVGCNEVVKRTSAYAHQASDECKARTQIKNLRERGLVDAGNWTSEAVDLFPPGTCIAPERGATSFRRGGWGRPNRTSMGTYFRKDAAPLLHATFGAESFITGGNDAARARLTAWFGALFASEETIRIGLTVYGLHFSSDYDGWGVAHYREKDCHAWAANVAAALGVPGLATSEQRDAEDKAIHDREQAEWRAKREAEDERYRQEEAERQERNEKRRRWSHRLPALVEAARNVAQPGSALHAALESFADFDGTILLDSYQ